MLCEQMITYSTSAGVDVAETVNVTVDQFQEWFVEYMKTCETVCVYWEELVRCSLPVLMYGVSWGVAVGLLHRQTSGRLFVSKAWCCSQTCSHILSIQSYSHLIGQSRDVSIRAEANLFRVSYWPTWLCGFTPGWIGVYGFISAFNTFYFQI